MTAAAAAAAAAALGVDCRSSSGLLLRCCCCCCCCCGWAVGRRESSLGARAQQRTGWGWAGGAAGAATVRGWLCCLPLLLLPAQAEAAAGAVWLVKARGQTAGCACKARRRRQGACGRRGVWGEDNTGSQGAGSCS